jgi:hypothetical protein
MSEDKIFDALYEVCDTVIEIKDKTYDLEDYQQREEYKTICWKQFNEWKEPEPRARALLGVNKCHYYRAVEDLEVNDKAKKLKMIRGKKYYKGYELDIDHYTRHWLHSMRHLVPKEIQKEMDDMGYNAEPNKYLPDGMTSYVFAKPPSDTESRPL